MEYVEVRTQAELDAALARDGAFPVIKGDGCFVVKGSATVEAWGSATVRAWDSATVEAWGSATVRAWDSATVEAWDSATVEAWGSATVRASKYNAVIKPPRSNAMVTGGVLIEVKNPTTVEEWCDFYGVGVEDGHAVLYKAVREDFSSNYRASFKYPVGETVEAPDWNPASECGYGLHFSPRPFMAAQFFDGAKPKFIACRVALANVAPLHGDDAVYPNKIKARACDVLYECDANGAEIAAAVA